MPTTRRGSSSAALFLLLTTVCSREALATDAGGREPTSGVPDVPDTLAKGAGGNGVYGRFDGNFSFSAGLGASYLSLSREVSPTLQLSGRFYQALGLYTGLSQSVTSSSPLARMLEIGLVLQPLFLLRFSRNAEWGKPFWDLTVDSLALTLGGHFFEPDQGNLGDLSGLSVGLGAAVPLLARAPGPWLRARGTVQTGSTRVEATAELLLEWQWMISAFQKEP